MAKSVAKTTTSKQHANKSTTNGTKSKVQKLKNVQTKKSTLSFRTPGRFVLVTVSVLLCSVVLYYVLKTTPPDIAKKRDQSADLMNNEIQDKNSEQHQGSHHENHDFVSSKGASVHTDTNTDRRSQDVRNEQTKKKKKVNVKKSSETNSKASLPKEKTVSREGDHVQGREDLQSFKSSILNSLEIRDIEIDGRIIKAQELKGNKPNNSSVRIYQYEDFLTQRECYGLMNAHNKHVRESNQDGPIICFDSVDTLRKHLDDIGMNVKVSERDFTQGTTCVNASFSQELSQLIKWSYSTSFYTGESKFSNQFDSLAEQTTGLLSTNGGKFQITSYPQGVGYKTHTDCIIGSSDKRDRFATILVYLQDVPRGGHTDFPELGISVKPKQGRAIVWNNMNEYGECEPLSIHTAGPVHRGHKYILQRWYYYQSFFALGSRNPEPELPPRLDGQPRVSCDTYESGSCRWYDEWNYDHLIDYQRMRATLQ